MATIRDVAEAAKVSIATVSNYINKTKPVSKNAEQRIKQVIEELGYTQNLFAKSLKSNTYNDVGVVLPNLNDSYYSQIYQGIEQAFKNSRYFLNLAFSYNIANIERSIVDNFLKKNICGLILITCMPDDRQYYHERFISTDRPLVLIDRMIHNLDSNFISFNNRKALSNLVKNLLAINKSSIYLFTGPKSFYCEAECIEGYIEAFDQAGLYTDESRIIENVLNKEQAFQKTIHLLKTGQPDAVIVTSELAAMGVVEAITLLGYKRNEIPVITLGEEHWNRYTHSFASLSTVRPAIQLGETAANLLQSQIQSPKTHEKAVILLNDSVTDYSCISLNEKTAPVKKAIIKEIKILLLDTPQVSAMEDLLPSFENATGIRVNVEKLPHIHLLDRILSASSSDGSQPDVYMFDIPWLYELASSGMLEDISGYVNDSSFDRSIFLPDCLKYFSEFEGKYYGLPFMYAPQILYYRKDLFENRALAMEYEKQFQSKLIPPRTWKEFAVVSEFFAKCTSPENTVQYGTSIPAAYKECLVPEVYMRLFSYGGSVYNKQYNIVFDTPQALKAYINLKSTIQYAKPDYKTATDISAVSDFLNGDTAMLITYPSFLTNVTDLRTISLTGGIGYSHIPGRTPILGGWSFGINPRSGKKDDAFKFLEWTVAKENANYFTLFGGQPVINSIFTNDELITLYPWLPLYHSAYRHTLPIVPPYKIGKQIISQEKIDSVIFNHAIALIDNEHDVSTAIAETHRDLTELFRSYDY